MLKPAAVIFVRNNTVLSDTFLIRSEPFINRSNTWRIAKNMKKNKISEITLKMKKMKTFLCTRRIILYHWYAGQACFSTSRLLATSIFLGSDKHLSSFCSTNTWERRYFFSEVLHLCLVLISLTPNVSPHNSNLPHFKRKQTSDGYIFDFRQSSSREANSNKYRSVISKILNKC